MKNIPSKLQNFQQNFAKSISQPFERPVKNKFITQDKLYEPSTLQSIKNQKNICAKDRLQLYNRSYWFRLINLFQEDMPLLTNLLELSDFNTLVITYLEKYPCQSPLINNYADNFLTFMKEKHQWNTPQLQEATKIEWAYLKTFDATHHQPIKISCDDQEKQEQISHQLLALQPHCFLIEESHNLMEFRAYLNQKDNDEAFPPLKKQKQYWLIFRLNNHLKSNKINPIQYQLLLHINQNKSLNDAIEQTVEKLNEENMQLFSQNIRQWFEEWIQKGILYNYE